MSTAMAQQKKIELQNVNPQTGDISSTHTTDILLDPSNELTISVDGNIEAHCLGQNGKCAGIGAGSTGGGGTFPTLTFTAPAVGAVIPDNDQTAQMTWSTTNAVECTGLDSSPNVSSWAGAKPTSGSFVVGSLPRDASSNRTYTFTMGCYSKSTSALPVENAGFVKKSYSVTLAPSSTGGGGQDPLLTCNAYRNSTQYGPVAPKNQKGFLTQPGAVLTERSLDFGTGFGTAFYSVMAQTAGGEGFLPGEQAQSGQYLSIPLVVPDGATFTNKGFKLSWSDPQVGGFFPGVIDINVSPCPGDFRQPTDSSDADPWLRPTCRKVEANNTSLSATTGNASGNTGVYCKLVKGTTMYLNITLHVTSQLGNPGNPVPDYRCYAGAQCAARIFSAGITTAVP